MNISQRDPAVILSHEFALMWYRALAHRESGAVPERFLVPCAQQADIIASATPSRGRVRSLLGSKESKGALIPHILVSGKRDRCRCSDYCEHYMSGPLPKDALWRARTQGLYVVSPELLFVQLSKTLPFVDLCMIGMELCGTYALPIDEHGTVDRIHGETDAGCLPSRLQITNPKRIAATLSQMPGFGPTSKAARALACIDAPSASPMESRLYLAMTLPRKWGGLGVPRPMLNHRVDLSPQERAILGKEYLCCDLYWDKKLAVEYESFERHSSPTEYEKTMARASVLRTKGFEYIAMTPRTFYNYDKLIAKVELIFKALGVRHREPSPQRQQLQRDLIRQLGASPSI